MSDPVPLIGDLVGSRRVPDRMAVQRHVESTLSHLSHEAPTLAQPLAMTVGDEMQGVAATIHDAVRAALLVRLALWDVVDVRFGLGRGAIQHLRTGAAREMQDGPGWWAARSAIDEIGGERERRRWWYAGADAAQVNAWLLCLDHLVGRLRGHGPEVARLTLTGLSQKEIAASLDISPSAVSQQLRGPAGVSVASLNLLDEAAPGGGVPTRR